MVNCHTHLGLILLDAEGDNFPVIVDKIVDQLVATEQLKEVEVDFVLQALYKKHKWVQIYVISLS